MLPDPSSPEAQEAAEELQLYLSDILPPLVVADSFKLLIRYPPGLVASRIREWTSSQFRPGGGISVSDYIYYAMRKVNGMGEFHLVPQEPFETFLEALKGLVLDFCPAAEQEDLRKNLTRLSETSGTVGSVDALIRRKAGSADLSAPAATPPPLSQEELRGLRRFSLILHRIGQQLSTEGAPADGPPGVYAQALAVAARESRSPQEFEKNLERFREMGLGVEASDMFRALGSSLPGWVPPEPRSDAGASGAPGQAGPGGAVPAPVESGSVEAMHRIVAQPENPGEVASRFNAMVKSAIEQFNNGALPQAVTMLALAERIVAENQVDASTVDAVRGTGDQAIDVDRIRKCAEVPRFHGMLRRVLAFFTATNVPGLLNELLREPKRERRRLILQLLEVHGGPAREAALDRLRSAFGQAEGDEKWYYRRNLLYVLRRLPPARGEPLDEDVDRAVRHAVLRFPSPLVKEAVANLGQLKHERAESALISLLHELEGMLLRPAEATYDVGEVRLLLDRVVSALARFGTSKARSAVVEHGLGKKSEWGDTTARLAELAGQDLSGDAELVDRLLSALKSRLPHRVLGMVLKPKDQNARHIIEALSTTSSPAVRAALEEIARRFRDQDIGRAAGSALTTLSGAGQVADAPYDSRAGELELFGLPALIQVLADLPQAGTLTLKGARGDILAEIALRAGKMKSCEAGKLKGEEAFYQLLERPAAGTYVFALKAPEPGDDARSSSFKDVISLCLEGMRRYDELALTTALIPDDVKLKTTQVRPERHPDERDGMFVNGLWRLAAAGSTPLECEAALVADSYRIRRQLAHWVETGALAGA